VNPASKKIKKLKKKFSHTKSKFVLIFGTSAIKLKLGLQVGERG
jgi:hypothetical protein